VLGWADKSECKEVKGSRTWIWSLNNRVWDFEPLLAYGHLSSGESIVKPTSQGRFFLFSRKW